MAALRCAWPLKLRHLTLDWNAIGEDGAVSLAEAIQGPAAVLESLDLRSNPLGDRGVGTICEAAAQLDRLRWLGLGETSLGDEGAKAAMRSLAGCVALEGLDIGENLLTDSSCEAVAGLVAVAPRLRCLVLRGFLFEPVRISDAGGQAIARAVAARSLRRRDYAAAHGEDGTSFAAASSAFELDLAYQQVGCKTAMEMAHCCGSWSRFSAFNTEVSTAGVTALANALREHRGAAAAARVNVAQCRVGAGAVELLKKAGLARLDCHGQRCAAKATS